mgnify:CR=1 FL=1
MCPSEGFFGLFFPEVRIFQKRDRLLRHVFRIARSAEGDGATAAVDLPDHGQIGGHHRQTVGQGFCHCIAQALSVSRGIQEHIESGEMIIHVIGFPMKAKTDVEIALLGNLISLTPGSLTLDISSDRAMIYVHLMYFSDMETELKQFRAFERRVLTVLR